jgi:hypothetical protein
MTRLFFSIFRKENKKVVQKKVKANKSVEVVALIKS